MKCTLLRECGPHGIEILKKNTVSHYKCSFSWFAKVEGAPSDFQPLRAGSIVSGICGANANYLITSGTNQH